VSVRRLTPSHREQLEHLALDGPQRRRAPVADVHGQRRAPRDVEQADEGGQQRGRVHDHQRPVHLGLHDRQRDEGHPLVDDAELHRYGRQHARLLAGGDAGLDVLLVVARHLDGGTGVHDLVPDAARQVVELLRVRVRRVVVRGRVEAPDLGRRVRLDLADALGDLDTLDDLDEALGRQRPDRTAESVERQVRRDLRLA
jgi:hypothetical protein